MALQADLAALKEGLVAINEQLSSFSALQRLAKRWERLEAEENINAQMTLLRKVMVLGRAPVQYFVPVEEGKDPTEVAAYSDSVEKEVSLIFQSKEIESCPEISDEESKLDEEEKMVDQLFSPNQLGLEKQRNETLPQKRVISLFESTNTQNWGIQVDRCLEIGKASEEQKIQEIRMSYANEILKWYRWERDKTKLWVFEKFLLIIQKAEKWPRKEDSEIQRNFDIGKMPRTHGVSKAKGDFVPTRIPSLTTPFNKHFKEWVVVVHNSCGVIWNYILQSEQESEGQWINLMGYAYQGVGGREPRQQERSVISLSKGTSSLFLKNNRSWKFKFKKSVVLATTWSTAALQDLMASLPNEIIVTSELTLGSNFKIQLQFLLGTMSSLKPHRIRYLKKKHGLKTAILEALLNLRRLHYVEYSWEWKTCFRLPTLRTRLFSKRAVVIGMVQRRREEIWHEKGINLKKKHSAHQVFDIMHLQQQRLHPGRKMSLARKTWKFKFKQKFRPPTGHSMDMIKHHESKSLLSHCIWRKEGSPICVVRAAFQNRNKRLGTARVYVWHRRRHKYMLILLQDVDLMLDQWVLPHLCQWKEMGISNQNFVTIFTANFEWEAALEEGKWAVKVNRRSLKLWMMQALFQRINHDLSLGSSSQVEKEKRLLQYKGSKVVNHLFLKERDNVWITPQEKLFRIHQLLQLRAKTWRHWFVLWVSSFSIWHRWKNKTGCNYVVFGGSNNIATLGGFFLSNKSLYSITLRTRLISKGGVLIGDINGLKALKNRPIRFMIEVINREECGEKRASRI